MASKEIDDFKRRSQDIVTAYLYEIGQLDGPNPLTNNKEIMQIVLALKQAEKVVGPTVEKALKNITPNTPLQKIVDILHSLFVKDGDVDWERVVSAVVFIGVTIPKACLGESAALTLVKSFTILAAEKALLFIENNGGWNGVVEYIKSLSPETKVAIGVGVAAIAVGVAAYFLNAKQKK